MRAFIHAPVALALSLLSPACDDMTETDTDADLEFGGDEDADAEDEVTPRCFPLPCTDPPDLNTNWIGTNPVESWCATAPPRMKPRASSPTTLSIRIPA